MVSLLNRSRTEILIREFESNCARRFPVTEQEAEEAQWPENIPFIFIPFSTRGF